MKISKIIVACVILISIILISIGVSAGIFWINNKDADEIEIKEKDLTKVINILYPEIVLDYLGVLEEKIIQDFGQPKSKFEATGFIDGGLWSDKHLYYNYSFENGTIAFYINKETKIGDYIEVILKENNDINIFIPGLIDKGPNYNDIILGTSTFGDIYKLMNEDARELRNIISYEGGSAGNSYTNLDFYFGKFGEYHEFTFGILGLYDQSINNDYKVLSDKKPSRLFIK